MLVILKSTGEMGMKFEETIFFSGSLYMMGCSIAQLSSYTFFGNPQLQSEVLYVVSAQANV